MGPWPLHCLVASPGVLRELTRAKVGSVVAGVLCSRSHGLLTGPAASVARDCRRKGTEVRAVGTSHTYAAICKVIANTSRFRHPLCLVAVSSVQVASCCFSGLCHFTGFGNTQSSSQRGVCEWRVVLSNASAGDHAKMSPAARP